MIEVSKDAFYRTIGSENVQPRSERTETIWENQSSRQQIGRSEPGYTNPGAPKRYWLIEDFAKRKSVA